MLTSHETAALAVILTPALSLFVRGILEIAYDAITWLRRRRLPAMTLGCNGELNAGCPDCACTIVALDEMDVRLANLVETLTPPAQGPAISLARPKDLDELERDEYDTKLSAWVARAQDNDLPVFGVHAGAYAYLPVED